jgi:hypothetical protein
MINRQEMIAAEQWFRDYVQLQFRMDKAIRKFTDSRFVDYYYGPPEWKAAVEGEPETPAADLMRAAGALLDTLPDQGFEAHRTTYLSKQVVALETVCRRLNGESFSLEDEVSRCFDIRPAMIPETQFEQGLALLEEALPGTGDLFERSRAFRTHFELPREKMHLLPELLQGLQGNVRFLLSEGRSDDEVRRYMLKYWIWPQEYAQKSIDFLKNPFREAYTFTYYYGRQLMKPVLEGPDRRQVFKRFLTEQLCPSDLVNPLT